MLPLVTLFLATSVSASSVSTVPLTKFHPNGPGAGVASRARAASIKSSSGGTTVPATSLAYAQYTTSVGIGNPPTYYNLVIDTGSSNTFCGTGTPYVRTSTSIPTGEYVNVIYGSASFSGVEYLDRVTLAPYLVITNQSIGDALEFSGFDGVDGILGVGPVILTSDTLIPDGVATIPTIMNNLVLQRLINRQVLGVYFAPSANDKDMDGALTYGGVDQSLFSGDVMYVSLTETLPAAYYWGINVTNSMCGTHTIIPGSTAGIVDTGTTLVLLADDFFAVYMDAIPGAVYDSSLGLVEIPPSSISHMQSLYFTIGDRTLTMDVAAQLFPTHENKALGGDPGKQYGVVGKMGSSSGQGMDFILGQKFIERYYTVLDASANRVGFAETGHTFAQQ